MNTLQRVPTINDALAELQGVLREELGDAGPSGLPKTPDGTEATCFRMAELLVGLACPGPGACSNSGCRSAAACRHWLYVKAKERSGRGDNPRPTSGAEAVRYAVWVYMSSGR